jgi:mannose-1-phosphate guanylyltransferase/mannose-6-phosphate isomerase
MSRELFPKQYIAFQPGKGSLFQETLKRLEGLEDCGPPIVVCNQANRFLVAEQLHQTAAKDAVILLEPVRRNTAPIVALAAMEAERVEAGAVLLVLPCDHLIEVPVAFASAVSTAGRHARAGLLVTFGIVPIHPETGFGYIRRGDVVEGGFRMEHFVEKPDRKTATAYLESGEYYWNSGMFMFCATRYLQELKNCNPLMLDICRAAYAAAEHEADFRRIPEQVYSACPSDSIDKAAMESTRHGIVIPLDAGWSDLGSWDTLWRHGQHDDRGNVVHGDVILRDTGNSYVQAASRLVAVVGMKDTVVVETGDAVLVGAMDRMQDVKVIFNQLTAANHPTAESHRLVYRSWGCYETLAQGQGFQVKRIVLHPGASLSTRLQRHCSGHWVVVSGTPRVTRGEEVFPLREKESVDISPESDYRLENPTDSPAEVIEIEIKGSKKQRKLT